MSATADLPAVTRLRVLHYYPRALTGDGGPTNALLRLAAATAAGADIAVACLPGPGELAPGVTVWPVGYAGRGRARVPRGLEPLLECADLLVLHSGWVAHNARAGALARHARVPYVLTPHGAYDPLVVGRHALRKRLWWLAAERRLVAGATAVHVFFEAERDDLAALGYRGPTIVAPNIVEVPAGRRWDGGSGGYLLWLGRFDPEHKGLDTLLRAVSTLAPALRPHVRLHGPDWRGRRADLQRLRDELGLEGSVEIGGPVYGEEKWDLMQRAAAFVYPSRWEAFGIALGEAAALGVPCLVTPCGLGRLLASRGGAVLAGHDPESLADGIGRVLGDAAVGAAGAEVMRTELSAETIGRSWLEQAEEVLA